MPTSTAGFCRNGHDLAVLGRAPNGRNGTSCRMCKRLADARYRKTDANRAAQLRFTESGHRQMYEHQRARDPQRRAYQRAIERAPATKATRAQYKNSPRGQIVNLKSKLKARMRQKIARIAELEGELQSYAGA